MTTTEKDLDIEPMLALMVEAARKHILSLPCDQCGARKGEHCAWLENSNRFHKVRFNASFGDHR